jgi:hypothetical protein
VENHFDFEMIISFDISTNCFNNTIVIISDGMPIYQMFGKNNTRCPSRKRRNHTRARVSFTNGAEIFFCLQYKFMSFANPTYAT